MNNLSMSDKYDILVDDVNLSEDVVDAVLMIFGFTDENLSLLLKYATGYTDFNAYIGSNKISFDDDD